MDLIIFLSNIKTEQLSNEHYLTISTLMRDLKRQSHKIFGRCLFWASNNCFCSHCPSPSRSRTLTIRIFQVSISGYGEKAQSDIPIPEAEFTDKNLSQFETEKIRFSWERRDTLHSHWSNSEENRNFSPHTGTYRVLLSLWISPLGYLSLAYDIYPDIDIAQCRYHHSGIFVLRIRYLSWYWYCSVRQL